MIKIPLRTIQVFRPALHIILYAVTLWAAACTRPTVPAAEQTPWHQAVLPDAQERLIASRHTGKTYRIQTIAVGRQPPEGYPVLYLLDGDAFFPAVAAEARSLAVRASANRTTPLLIVAVGYPGGQPFSPDARAEDYTPPSENRTGIGNSYRRFGGAEAFQRFLNTELKPEIATRFKTHPCRQSLFGHSYGGLFALYILFKHTGDFQDYLIASPSIWWDDARILESLPAFLDKRRQPLPHTSLGIQLTVGEYEQKPPPYLTASPARQALLKQRRMVERVLTLNNQLAALPRQAAVSVHARVYPATTHAGTAFYSLSDGLKFIYARCRQDPGCSPADPP